MTAAEVCLDCPLSQCERQGRGGLCEVQQAVLQPPQNYRHQVLRWDYGRHKARRLGGKG